MTRDETLTAEEVEGKDKKRMTFDEEVYEYAKSRNGTEDSRMTDRMLAYRAGAKSREKQIQIDAEQIRALQKQNGELTDKVKELKILISSLVYEINQIWDISEMNDDLRRCVEEIDREVQLSKMAEDNRIVISALGFAIVPPKPKLDVKEI